MYKRQGPDHQQVGVLGLLDEGRRHVTLDRDTREGHLGVALLGGCGDVADAACMAGPNLVLFDEVTTGCLLYTSRCV